MLPLINVYVVLKRRRMNKLFNISITVIFFSLMVPRVIGLCQEIKVNDDNTISVTTVETKSVDDIKSQINDLKIHKQKLIEMRDYYDGLISIDDSQIQKLQSYIGISPDDKSISSSPMNALDNANWSSINAIKTQ